MEKNTPIKMRMNLGEQAQQATQAMLKDLVDNYEHMKASPSDLVSWIIVAFHEKHFAKVRDQMASDHFDSRGYLQEVVRKMGQADGDEKLLEAVAEKISKRNRSKANS